MSGGIMKGQKKATEACRCCSLLDKQLAFFESKNLSVIGIDIR